MRNFTLQGLMWIEEEGWIKEEKRDNGHRKRVSPIRDAHA